MQPRRRRHGRSPRCIDRFDCKGGIAPAAGNPDLGMMVSRAKDRRKDEFTHLRLGLALPSRPGVFRLHFLSTTSDPMSAKRASSSPGAASSPEHAVTNAILLTAALGWGFSLLIQRGRLTWPPLALLSSLSTLAGCLALVGPLILARSGGKQGSLGELVWLTGGLLVWLFDIAAALRGSSRGLSWATPLGDRTMGLVMLAVLLAGWRCSLAGRDWSWTNVMGWALGVFWVAMAAGSWFLTPASGLSGLVSR